MSVASQTNQVHDLVVSIVGEGTPEELCNVRTLLLSLAEYTAAQCRLKEHRDATRETALQRQVESSEAACTEALLPFASDGEDPIDIMGDGPR